MDTTPKRSKLKLFIGIFLVLVIIGAAGAYFLYDQVYGTNVILTEDKILTIPTNTDLNGLATILETEHFVKSGSSFALVAQQMSFLLKPGKYKIPKSTKSNLRLVRVLQGHQLAIKLTFHNFRKKEQLAGYLGAKIATDSLEFIALLNNEAFLAQYGFNPNTVMAAFIPNTYEVYWDYTAEQFWKRMQQEYKKFWNEERLAKADSLGLSPIEVYTLASIVECESQYKPERPRIAGVYLNRLHKEGWKLEADPTVVFAVGDFSLKRVLNKHLETDSPYNTYMYAGLPPGPIYMASINAIDAVLNAEEHTYMFFCAKPHQAGQANTHAFAKTLRAHLRNAKVYWAWLRKQ